MLMNDNDYCNHPDYAKSSSNSLRVLGWLAVSLGFVEIAVGTMIYGQRWFGSISAGARTRPAATLGQRFYAMWQLRLCRRHTVG
jgi:hypothetical protein